MLGQNDMTFVNQGIQAFRNLELEKAVALIQEQDSVYPKGYNVTSRLTAAEFLLQGIREEPADMRRRSGAFRISLPGPLTMPPCMAGLGTCTGSAESRELPGSAIGKPA